VPCVGGKRNAGCTMMFWGPRFDSRAVHMEFAKYKVALRQIFCHIFQLLSVGMMLSVLHTHIYICHKYYIILALNRGRLVNPVINLQVPQNVENFWTS